MVPLRRKTRTGRRHAGRRAAEWPVDAGPGQVIAARVASTRPGRGRTAPGHEEQEYRAPPFVESPKER
jgi:hypothetical protein